MESELYLLEHTFVAQFMSNNCKPQNPTKMENNYKKSFKSIMINGLVVMLAVGGLTSEWCSDQQVCVKEITNYLPNSKNCTLPPKSITVTIGSGEVCPQLTIKTEHTPESYTCD